MWKGAPDRDRSISVKPLMNCVVSLADCTATESATKVKMPPNARIVSSRAAATARLRGIVRERRSTSGRRRAEMTRPTNTATATKVSFESTAKTRYTATAITIRRQAYAAVIRRPYWTLSPRGAALPRAAASIGGAAGGMSFAGTAFEGAGELSDDIGSNPRLLRRPLG